MATFEAFKKSSRAKAAQQNLETRRLIWVHRPIWIHDRAPKGQTEICACCNSKHAVRVETLQHIDVLVDRQTGQRWVRSAQPTDADRAKFDGLCQQAQRIDCPIRCSVKQLPVILDRTHRVIGVFGGERGGKSTIEAEWLFDRVLERGGIGSQFWWITKTRKKALAIGLKKLVKGERTDRWNRPIIPPELVVSYPRGVQHDIPLLLVDGTEIWFHHASNPDADNLKGEPPIAIVMDEGCTVDHQANWTQCKMRITDADGQLLTATTPVIGHYLQEEVRKIGTSYEDLERLKTDDPEAAAKVSTVWVSLSQPDNPWLAESSIDENIKGFHGDELKIRAHIYGEWVAIGRQLWRHFDPQIHLRDGPWRDVKGWGLVNITKPAAMRFFHRTTSSLERIGGQDFNIDPNNLVVAQIAVPKGMDVANRNNWIVFVLDHLQKGPATIREFAAWLGEAPRLFKTPPGYLERMAIACDPSGAHANPHASHGLRGASTLAAEMRRHGFDCRPCNLSEKGLPVLPSQIDSIALLHKLMADRINAPDGSVWPRLVIHASRCEDLVHSLQTQLADHRGGISKKSGTASDVLSGPTDALRYLTWAVPGPGPEYATRRAGNSVTH